MIVPNRVTLQAGAWAYCDPRHAPLASNEPRNHGYHQPGQRGADESLSNAVFHEQDENDRKGQHAYRTKKCAGRFQRGDLLSATLASETSFALAADLMLLDQGSACGEYRGNPQKEPPGRRLLNAHIFVAEAGKD